MSVVVIGLNHRTMPLDLFERMTIDDAGLPKALHELMSFDNLSEVVVLSTCNRTEVYAVAERFHGAYHDIRNFFEDTAFLPPEEFVDHLYVHYDREAVRHLFSVSAGLDSAVVGETEVLRQVKGAWERAQAEETTGPVLNLLFRHAVETGKRARTDTAIARGTASVSHSAVEMAAERLGSLDGRRALILGAGEMAEGMAAALRNAGVVDLLVVNRTWDRAKALADRVAGRPVRLVDLPTALADVDMLLTSTGATSIIVDHGDLAPVMADRGDRPMLIIDIAVPRDVDPSIGELPGVTLLDMTDLRRFAQAGRNRRSAEMAAVDAIVTEEVQRYTSATSARSAAPLVAAMHQQAEQMRQREMERFRGRLEGLDDRQRDAVEALTRAMLAKVLHEPSVRLKDLAGTPKGDRLAEALRELYDLDEL